MIKYFGFLIAFLISAFVSSQTTILDSETGKPVSYATVSFGNGNGIFADDEGLFVFTKKYLFSFSFLCKFQTNFD